LTEFVVTQIWSPSSSTTFPFDEHAIAGGCDSGAVRANDLSRLALPGVSLRQRRQPVQDVVAHGEVKA
jgi:hypothetical protein